MIVPGHTLASSPITTSPIITAARSTQAVAAICGRFPRYARMSGPFANIPRGERSKRLYLKWRNVFRGKKSRLLIDLHRRAHRRSTDFREPRGHCSRHAKKALGPRAIFAERCHGLAGIAANTNARVNLNFAQHGHAILLGGLRALAVAKNIYRLATMRARKRAHIFHHAEDF